MAIVILRTMIIFLTLLILMRLLGKRQLGELELSELVVSVLIADLAAHPLQDIGIPLLNGLIPIIVLFCCELIISGLIVKNISFRNLLCGKPSMLIENGKINQKEMRRCRFTLDELTEELRGQGYMDIAKIKYAILETNGTLSAMLFPAEKPATVRQLGISAEDPGFYTIVINDGRVLSNNLQRIGRDEKWLDKELQRRGLRSPREVYLLIVNDLYEIYCAPKEASS